jgi:hypothetical protein
MRQKSNLYHAEVLTQNLKMWLIATQSTALSATWQATAELCQFLSGPTGKHSQWTTTPYVNFSFSKTQLGIEGEKIWWHHHISRTNTSCTCQIQNMGLLQMQPTLPQSLDFLHQVTWEPFQWEQHGTEDNCNYNREKSTTLKWFYYKYRVHTSLLFHVTYLDSTVHESHVCLGLSLVKVPQNAIIQYVKGPKILISRTSKHY